MDTQQLFRVVDRAFYPVLALLVLFRLKAVWVSLLGLVVFVHLTKMVVQRRRPDGSDNFSFPSGHTAVSWLMAHAYRWNPLVVVWAGIVSVSRVILRRHYPSDVVAGAITGVLFGRVSLAS